jgi:hypothetical protein
VTIAAPRLALVALLVAVAGAAAAQDKASADNASTADALDRVRAALAKPPSRLTLTERVPDFTVHIEKRRPMQDIFDVPPWATDPVGWQPPGIGFDLLSVVRYVAKSVSDAKRGHDERLAREEVQRAIADYCAGLDASDGAAASFRTKTAQICSTSPAIR